MSFRAGKLTEVARDSFALICSEDDSTRGGFAANQGFVLLENSVLVFDSGFSLPKARNLDKAIGSVTDNKIRYLINSHDHSDHVFGNSFFWKKYAGTGLTIISHEGCRSRLVQNGSKRLAKYLREPELRKSLESIEICCPGVTYSDPGMRFEVAGTKLVLSHPPTGAHTLGDTALFLPQKRVVFAGDIICNSFFPNLEDANLEGWISYLEEIDLSTYRRFVPGHGEVCGPETVVEFREYLKTVRENLLRVDLSKFPDNDISSLRSCFTLPGSEDWGLRSLVDQNASAILSAKKSGD